MTDRQSSLRMIQNLDRDSDSLESQLDEIYRILHYGINGPDCHARAHWALRWILRRMQAKGESDAGYVPFDSCTLHVFLLTESNSCCTSLKAWDLLLQIARRLPPIVIIPTLTSFDFASSLESALALRHSAATEPITSCIYPSDTNSIDHGFPSSSRKRKAVAEISATRKKRRGSPNDGPSAEKPGCAACDIFTLASTCLKAFKNSDLLANGPNQYRMGNNNRSRACELRFAVVQSARILNGALKASMCIRKRAKNSDDPDFRNKAALQDIAPFLALWLNRTASPREKVEASEKSANDATVRTLSDLTFAQGCLPSTLLALNAFGRDRGAGSSPLSPTAKSMLPQVSHLERLVAHHVILPIKNVLQQSHFKGDEEESRITALVEDKELELYLGSWVAAKSVVNGVMNDQSGLLPALFNIAVHSASLSSPKQRANETAWLESLFLYMLYLLGFDLRSNAQQKPTPTAYSILETLMDCLQRHDITVKPQYLELLVDHYCVEGDATRDTNWNIIASCVVVNKAVFFRGSRAINDTRQPHSILSKVATAASATAWTVSGLPKGSIVVEGHPVRYSFIKNYVIIPLMKCSGTERSLEAFISTWLEQLESFNVSGYILSRDQMHDRTDCLYSVWEDSDLSEALKSTFDKSVATDLVVTSIERFGSSVDSAIESGKTASLAALFVVLHAMMSCIRDAESTERLTSRLASIQSSCVRLLCKRHSYPRECRIKAWRLLSKVQELWSASVDADAFDQQFSDASATSETKLLSLPPLVHEQLYELATIAPSWNMILEASESLNLLGSLFETALNKHSSAPWSHIPMDLLDVLRTALSPKDPYQDGWARYALCSVCVRHPVLLSSFQPTVETSNPKRSTPSMSDLVGVIVQEVHKVLFGQKSEPKALSQCWEHLVQDMMNPDGSMQTSFRSIREAQLRSFFLTAFMDLDLQANHKDVKNEAFFRLTHLIYLSSEAAKFPAARREALIRNILCEINAYGEQMSVSEWQRRLALMVHILQAPGEDADLVGHSLLI